MKVVRKGDCQHPFVTDAELIENEQANLRTWGDAGTLFCIVCREYLYPNVELDDELGEDVLVVYVGEPRGAGDDPAGRPTASEHPEFWRE